MIFAAALALGGCVQPQPYPYQAMTAEEQQMELHRQRMLMQAASGFMQMGQPGRLPYGAYQLPSNNLSCTTRQVGAFGQINCF
jgi:hypothetical protein